MSMSNELSFDKFLSKILNLEKGSAIKVIDKNRRAVFMASYTTKKFPDDEYIKLFFTDTLLEIMPSQEEVYFCDDSRKEISRSLITSNGKYLNIDGKQYVLENANDIQIVNKIYFGDIVDGEGGCRFSDYIFEDEIWSLATLDNGKISDVHARRIKIGDICFGNQK